MGGLFRRLRMVCPAPWAVVASMIALGLMLLGCASVPAQSSEWPVITPAPLPTPDKSYADPELGDCFGGVLSGEDALHCYALESAQSEGLIDVDKIYGVGGSLYLSLRQDEPLGDEVYAHLKERAYEFVDRWPHLVAKNPIYNICTADWGDGSPTLTYRQCLLDMTMWMAGGFLPWSIGYDHLIFFTGGESARRQQPGWASWRQLWPVVESGGEGRPGAAPYGAGTRLIQGSFYVSDVDVTNFSKADCNQLTLCGYRETPPEHHVAGNHSGGGTMYVQIKDAPTDEAELEALKEKIFPGQGRTGPYRYTRDGETRSGNRKTAITVKIIPVKYSYEELWQWATILERFALSAGNTVGVARASVGHTGMLRGALRPLDGVSRTSSPADHRETIVVWTTDPEGLVDALPVLLPQLGIPVDAVGIVAP